MYVDCAVIVTVCEPEPLVLESPGPETEQLPGTTSCELHVTTEVLPFFTRVGLAVMLACGETTVTDANPGVELPPAPEQTT